MPTDPTPNPTAYDKLLASPPGSWRRKRAVRPRTEELLRAIPPMWREGERIAVSPELILDAVSEQGREIYRLAELVESLGGDPATPGSEEFSQEHLEQLARK